jgi:lipopolysaccharide transport system permease protein
MTRSRIAYPALAVPHARISGDREPTLPYFNPLKPLRLIRQHRVILWQLSQKSLEAGHRGSVLGSLWLIMDPLLLLGIYGFVFGVLFQIKGGWNGNDPNDSYLLNMYAGIVTFGIFSQAANMSTGIIRASTGYVKQMVFPVEVIPLSVVGAMLKPTVIGVIILVTANGFWGTGFAWTVLLYPLAILPIVLLAMGTAFAFSALGVFIPDLGKISGVMTTILFFFTPIVWPIIRLTSRIPPKWQWLPYASPLTVGIEAVRDVIIRHQVPSVTSWVVATVLSAVAFQVGFAVFMRCRRAFADVI